MSLGLRVWLQQDIGSKRGVSRDDSWMIHWSVEKRVEVFL